MTVLQHQPISFLFKYRCIIQKIISEQIRLGTYKGLRRSRRPNPLPIHGQRTRHNARTAKGHKRITVANKKKAPTAK